MWRRETRSTNHGYLVSLRHMWSGYYLFQNGSVMWQVSGDNGVLALLNRFRTSPLSVSL
jgi:hypothetical protein